MVRNSPCAKFAIRLTAYSSVNATADSDRIAAVDSPTPTLSGSCHVILSASAGGIEDEYSKWLSQ